MKGLSSLGSQNEDARYDRLVPFVIYKMRQDKKTFSKAAYSETVVLAIKITDEVGSVRQVTVRALRFVCELL